MSTKLRWMLVLSCLLLPGALFAQKTPYPSGKIPAGRDCLTSLPRGTEISFAENPLPADFFFDGSSPFKGALCLGGTEENDGADICFDRLDAMNLEAPGSTARSRLVVRSLRMVGCEPLVVRRGSYEERWTVEVGLSKTAVSPGWITLLKTHRNGGTLTGSFKVSPRFVFTRVGSPSEVRVFDTGQEKLGPFQVIDGNSPGMSWVHRLNPGSRPSAYVDPEDPEGRKNFVPGVIEDILTGNQTTQEAKWPCPPSFVRHNFTDRLIQLGNDVD